MQSRYMFDKWNGRRSIQSRDMKQITFVLVFWTERKQERGQQLSKKYGFGREGDFGKSGQMYAEPQQCFCFVFLFNKKHKALHDCSTLGDPVCTLCIALDFQQGFYTDPFLTAFHHLGDSLFPQQVTTLKSYISHGTKGPKHLKVISDCTPVGHKICVHYISWIHAFLVAAMILF